MDGVLHPYNRSTWNLHPTCQSVSLDHDPTSPHIALRASIALCTIGVLTPFMLASLAMLLAMHGYYPLNQRNVPLIILQALASMVLLGDNYGRDVYGPAYYSCTLHMFLVHLFLPVRPGAHPRATSPLTLRCSCKWGPSS